MTAVEWLIKQIKSDQNQKALSINEWMHVIEQAKEMEKEQIIKAHIEGYDSSGESAIEYYEYISNKDK